MSQQNKSWKETQGERKTRLRMTFLNFIAYWMKQRPSKKYWQLYKYA